MDTLQRDVKVLKTYAICLTAAFVFVAGTGFQQRENRDDFDEINVKRINIVDNSGRKLIVLSNREKFPNPVIGGKEFPRSIQPSGIVFYDDSGTECGGIAVATLPAGRRTAIIFDYSNTEAIGFSSWEARNGSYGAGFSIQDRNPLGADIMKVGTEGINRISLANDNRNAELALSDTLGNKRIRLRVDSTGTARIEIFDEKGKLVSSLPEERTAPR